MQVFKLVPKNLDHNDWSSSAWKQAVLVRAPSEEAARRAASLAFRTATYVIPGALLPGDPWRQETLVEARTIDATDIERFGWPTEGPVEILEPPDHNEVLSGVNWEGT